MGDLAEAGVRSGAIDDDEITCRFHRGDGGRKALVKGVLVGAERVLFNLGQVSVIGGGQVKSAAVQIGAAVFDIAAKGLLAQVKV